MTERIAPSAEKAQALRALLEGQNAAQSGEELLSALVRLSTERVLQDALEEEQAQALGRGRYERGDNERGYRNGYGSSPSIPVKARQQTQHSYGFGFRWLEVKMSPPVRPACASAASCEFAVAQTH
jgi:mutator family transposase